MTNTITPDEFLQAVYGFRLSYLVFALSDACSKAKSMDTIGKIQDEILEMMGKPSNTATRVDLQTYIAKFKNLIEYARFDCNIVWSGGEIIPCYDHKRPASCMVNTHSMSDKILKAYIQSMDELHAIAYIHLDKLKSYIVGKTILDVGCGTSCYLPDFCRNGYRSYTGLDRKNILDLIRPYRKYAFIPRSEWREEPLEEMDTNQKWDVIWLSEVLHSKKCPAEFLEMAAKFLVPKGRIIINELIPDTVRSAGFKTQLQLHTGTSELMLIPKADLEREYYNTNWEVVEECIPTSRFHEAVILKRANG